jgi:hypothetical protein
MKRFRLRRIAVLIMVVALICIVGAMNSIAAEKIKLSDTRYWFITKTEEIKLDDAEGHVLQIREAKGVDVGSKGLSVAKSTVDLVKGNGTFRGYSTWMGPDGGVMGFFRQEAKVTTTLSPEGKPITTMEGTYSLIRGVGEWQGATGGGTWKLRMISEGISVMDFQGELVKP